MRTMILTIGEDNGVQIEHDDFTGPELAAFAVILQNKALEVLKNGSIEHVQIRSPNSG